MKTIRSNASRGGIWRVPMYLKKRGKGVVAVTRKKLPALSAEQVRETLERVRR